MDNDGPSVPCQAGSIAVEATIISPDVLLSAIVREARTVFGKPCLEVVDPICKRQEWLE